MAATRTAADWKAEGNAHFGKGQFAEAAAAYTEAIALEEDAVYYSNRCACRLKLGALDDALSDATRLRDLKPKWVKTAFREGCVLHALGRHVEAARAFCEAMLAGPSDEVRAMLEQTIAAAGLHDDPEQQELLHRCLQVLHSSRPADMPAKREAGGGQWRRCVQPSKDGPPPRGGATLTAVGSALWLIGGLDAARGALTPDVFSLDTTVEPSAWSLEHGSVRGGAEHNGTGTPAARFGHAACARGAVVWLFGGHAGPDGHASADDSGVFSDVHALDTRTCAWVEARAADAPEARHAHSLCYDAHGDQLLLFGGADGKSKPLGGLHALPLGSLGVDGLPDAPSAEAGHSAPPGDRAESVPLRWVSIEPSGGGPCAREMHASAVTCPARDGTAAEAPPVMLVCGGRAAGQVLSDLWVLHLGSLTWQLCPCPHARCSHGLSVRPTGDGEPRATELVIFGGFDGQGICQSTLTLQLAAVEPGCCKARWEDVSDSVVGAPRARIGHAQAATRQSVYVFGGGAEDGTFLGDTCRLTLASC